jgi:hypothetical protein
VRPTISGRIDKGGPDRSSARAAPAPTGRSTVSLVSLQADTGDRSRLSGAPAASAGTVHWLNARVRISPAAEFLSAQNYPAFR